MAVMHALGVALVFAALCPSAQAAEGLVLPPGEDREAWTAALSGTGLVPLEQASARVEVVDGAWTLVVVDRGGVVHRVAVEPPTDDLQRQDLAFLALSLLEPAGLDSWQRGGWGEAPPAPSVPEPQPPEAAVLVSAPPAPPAPSPDAPVHDTDPTASGPEPQPSDPPAPNADEPLDLATEPTAPTPALVALEPQPASSDAGAAPTEPPAPATQPFVDLQLGLGWWSGWPGRAVGRLHLGAALRGDWRFSGGLQLADAMDLGRGRAGSELGGGILLSRRALGPGWASLGAELTRRRFTLGGAEVDRSWVPSAEVGIGLALRAPAGLELRPGLSLRRDLRVLQLEVGGEDRGLLPPWDLQASLTLCWMPAGDQPRAPEGT